MLFRSRAQLRADLVGSQLLEAERQRTELQLVGEGLGAGRGEAAADLGATVEDRDTRAWAPDLAAVGARIVATFTNRLFEALA